MSKLAYVHPYSKRSPKKVWADLTSKLQRNLVMIAWELWEELVDWQTDKY